MSKRLLSLGNLPVAPAFIGGRYDMFFCVLCVSAFTSIAFRPISRLGLKRAVQRASQDRKSTRLNSSHLGISYAVFCLKKKPETKEETAKVRDARTQSRLWRRAHVR